MPLIKKNLPKFCYLFVCLVMILSILACSLSDSVIEDAISRTEAAQPTATITATETPTTIPTVPPTPIPTFTPVTETIATQIPLALEIEPTYNTLSEALIRIDQLVPYFDENFKAEIPDFVPIGLASDCQIDCAGRWVSGKFDTFDLIIELEQLNNESTAIAAVEEIKSDLEQWEFTEYPALDWKEYSLPEDLEKYLPDKYLSGFHAHEDMVEAVATTNYGPVLLHITVLDYERGWADYPNILLMMTTILQIMNLTEMQFE